MEMWKQQKTISLIKDLHRTPCLWDVQCLEYRNKNFKTDAIATLANKYKVRAIDLEKKIQALKSQFRREHKKILDAESNCHPKCVNWFGYEHLLFLLDGYEPRRSRSTENILVKPELNLDLEENNSDIETSASDSADYGEFIHSDDKTIEFISSPTPQKRKNQICAAEAIKCIKTLSESVSKRDEFSVYGEHIANRLRNSGRPLLEIVMAQHQIDEICFKLTMGAFTEMTIALDLKSEPC